MERECTQYNRQIKTYIFILISVQAGVTLLMSVASRGNLPVTRELIQQGAQVNTEDNVSTTITYHLYLIP